MVTFETHSPAETRAVAAKLAEKLNSGDVIAFRGSMGMGKTCFTAGLAEALGFCGDITSPTFALVNEYRGGKLNIWHFDMYRIENWEDLYSTGFFDYLEMDGITLIEWSENIESALPNNTITISFEKMEENGRKITVSGGVF